MKLSENTCEHLPTNKQLNQCVSECEANKNRKKLVDDFELLGE
jgi:hypothetical protein